ncbi:MAG: ribosome-binding factor A [Flavobacteriales bacterium AspAUS03]
METIRQKKAAALIRKELAELIRRELSCDQSCLLISVIQVHVTTDLGLARIYIRFFPPEEKAHLFEIIRTRSNHYKKLLAKELRYQFRKFPELDFRIDDSLEYIEKIEKELRGEGQNLMK